MSIQIEQLFQLIILTVNIFVFQKKMWQVRETFWSVFSCWECFLISFPNSYWFCRAWWLPFSQAQGVDSIYGKVQDNLDESFNRWETVCRDRYFKDFRPKPSTSSSSEKTTVCIICASLTHRLPLLRRFEIQPVSLPWRELFHRLKRTSWSYLAVHLVFSNREMRVKIAVKHRVRRMVKRKHWTQNWDPFVVSWSP